MSSKDLLYTNKFTYDDIDDFDEFTNKDKENFKEQYEKKFGIPNDLLNNNDNYLNDYNIIDKELNIVNKENLEKDKKPIKIIKKLKKSIISIDSKDRDVDTYISPNSFKINLPKKYSNISRIRLVSTEFPNTEQVIRSQPAEKKK